MLNMLHIYWNGKLDFDCFRQQFSATFFWACSTHSVSLQWPTFCVVAHSSQTLSQYHNFDWFKTLLEKKTNAKCSQCG